MSTPSVASLTLADVTIRYVEEESGPAEAEELIEGRQVALALAFVRELAPRWDILLENAEGALSELRGLARVFHTWRSPLT